MNPKNILSLIRWLIWVCPFAFQMFFRRNRESKTIFKGKEFGECKPGECRFRDEENKDA